MYDRDILIKYRPGLHFNEQGLAEITLWAPWARTGICRIPRPGRSSRSSQIIILSGDAGTIWQKLICSADRLWGGPVNTPDISRGKDEVVCEPESVLVPG